MARLKIIYMTYCLPDSFLLSREVELDFLLELC